MTRPTAPKPPRAAIESESATPAADKIPGKAAAKNAAEASAEVPKNEAELDELERAMARLAGRDPELAVSVARARREGEASRKQLARKLRGERAEIKGRQKRHTVLIGLLVAVGLGASYLGYLALGMYGAEQARREELGAMLDQLASPIVSRGFGVQDEQWDVDSIEVSFEARSCLVGFALGPEGPVNIRVEGDVIPTAGLGSVGVCECDAGKARFVAERNGAIGIKVLTAAGDKIGGPALLSLPPAPGAVSDSSAPGCAQSMLDTWLAAQVPAFEAPQTDLERKLVLRGLTPTDEAPAERPILILPAHEDQCFIALSRGGDDQLSLRKIGEKKKRLENAGPLGFCLSKASGFSVVGSGEHALSVFRAPAEAIGGIRGVRDVADSLGISVRTHLPAEDRQRDASAMLTASGIPVDVQFLKLDASERAKASIFAMSTPDPKALSGYDNDARLLCDPSLTTPGRFPLCIHAEAGGWTGPKKFPEGVVGGARPFWLRQTASSDYRALERDHQILRLNRRMSLGGFQLTTSEEVQWTPKGVRVTGRSGEAELTGVVLSQEPPFLHTLSQNHPWTAGEDPPLVVVKPGESVDLTANPPLSGFPVREVIVYRR